MAVYHDGSSAAIIDLMSYRVARKPDSKPDREIASELASSAGARARTRTREETETETETANSAAIRPMAESEVRGYHAMDELYAYYCDAFDRQRVAPSVMTTDLSTCWMVLRASVLR